MKTITKYFSQGVMAFLTSILLLTPALAYASTPYLQIYSIDNSNLQVTISGADPYQSVSLYTRQSDTQLWTILSNIGFTDWSGYYSSPISVGTFNPGFVRESYVVINGQQSSIVTTYHNNTPYPNGNIWFNPTSPTMNIGQSLAVSINSSSSGYYGPEYNNAYYVSSNSNSNAVSASISGTVLNLYAYQSGSASITVTHSSLAWSGTIYVTVNGNWNNNTISFSNSNPSVQIWQTTSVNIYSSNNYYGNFYVSNNSNSSVVTASISGSTLSLYGQANGNSTLTICQSGYSGCGTLYVTVTGRVYGSSTYANGQLLNNNGTIYQVYKNTLYGFSNEAAFLGLGYHFSDAMIVNYLNMPVSYVIDNSNSSHPWGTWVVSGQTIYFVHENGLIPIPTYDIFINNGGQDYLVVPINSYDWQRTQLPTMTYNDYRLRN